MSANKSVRIASLECKDLFAAAQAGKQYTLRFADGNPNYKKYINTLDYGLDLIKLREIYYKVYRRNKFGFFNFGKEYTKHVINVTFKYAYKLYNKCGKNFYVLDGHHKKDLKVVGCICLIDGELAAIELLKHAEEDKLPESAKKYFRYNETNQVYELVGIFPPIKNKRELRDYLYTNGFTVDGIEYVRFKRSSGSARVGKCLFIDKNLYKYIHKWDLCGLNVKKGDDIDLAAFEASISLTSSSIIDTIEIKPENILIIDDYESIFEDEVVGVTLKNGKLAAEPQRVKIKNTIWDGQALLDESLFAEKYVKRGMLLLRNRHFKSNGISTNIQKFFRDNNITEIGQLNGFTLATDISDIKMITTPSSIKYLKFGSLEDWLKTLIPIFGIVKYDKPTYYFDGRMVQGHYQLLNTLCMNYDEMVGFLKPSLEYVSAIRSDPAVLRYHIKYPYNEPENLEYSTKNDVIFGLLCINPDFAKTKLYNEFKKDLIKSYIKNLRRGHVLIQGNYSTLFGNGLEMLKYSIGAFDGKSEIGTGNIYSKAFADGETILASRSPHITMGNIYIAKNRYMAEYDEYFNLTKEIVCVNAINENLQQRLNGCDYDSDAVLLTDHKTLINKAGENYNKFLVPTSLVEAEKTKRKYSNLQQSDLDVKTSINKIGEIVNLSQELNSRFWNDFAEGKKADENMPLYYDICKLSVLSGIEIDKAKKEYLVDSQKEIKILKSKYKLENDKKQTVKPMFFKMITLENGYKLNPEIEYRYLKTSMDHLQKIISVYSYANRNQNKSEELPLASIINTIPTSTLYGRHYRQREEIIEKLREYKQYISSLYTELGEILARGEDFERKDKIRYIEEIKEKCSKYISSLKISEKTAYLLLKALDEEKFRDIRQLLFGTVFQSDNDAFWQLIADNTEETEIIREKIGGDLKLYDFEFIRENIQ